VNVGWSVLLVLAVIGIGGFFAAAEMALVSLREGQIRSLGRRGRRGHRAARLAQDPNRFLSSVQIGVTTATLMSGAFGAALLADKLASQLVHLGLSRDVSTPLAVVLVTLAISLVTLVFGELAPKRLALQRAERVSLIAGPVVDLLATAARPLVWFLSRCTNLVVQLLGGDPAAGRGVMTDEELRDLVAGHQALSPDERQIVSEVFDAGKRQIREILVPRTEVEFLPASMPVSDAAHLAEGSRFSRFPVFQESYDDVIGFVHTRDLLDKNGTGQRVGEVCRPVKFVPISKMCCRRCRRCARTGRTWRLLSMSTGGRRASSRSKTWLRN
jgi:putative hemolysin